MFSVITTRNHERYPVGVENSHLTTFFITLDVQCGLHSRNHERYPARENFIATFSITLMFSVINDQKYERYPVSQRTLLTFFSLPESSV
ncbi:hypothetical protein AVEN_233836-1 [Araneus ventricosus]|uniref:Uncharacterized protein n=1 Tax=Araneus ventricosus TaxID=182803 RepID=A0A4Y2H6L2_ARAVE|nr:hypothetical protein AVEN_233836-1 [Araneus ventricosus]